MHAPETRPIPNITRPRSSRDDSIAEASDNGVVILPLVTRLLLAGAVAAAAAACWGGGAFAGVRASPASTCAVAWNRGAAPSLRMKVAAEHPRGAFIGGGAVTIGTVTWSKAQAPTQTDATGCAIQFILRDGRTLMVSGAWKNGVITSWIGPVASNRTIPVPDNTTVHTDGTVGFHG